MVELLGFIGIIVSIVLLQIAWGIATGKVEKSSNRKWLAIDLKTNKWIGK